MNKIICDVCGTAYPETSNQCPICGSAKTTDSNAIAGENLNEEIAGGATYNYVKGGRFSKSNVRKRGKNQPETRIPKEHPSGEQEIDQMDEEMVEEESPKSNRGLLIAVVVLLLAIVAVVMYLALKYFIPVGDFMPGKEDTLPPAQTSSVATTDDGLIHCTNLNLTDTAVTLDGEGRQWLLNVTAEPMDTTDVITYTSSDASVVTVSESGTLTAVAEGTAVITIACGDISVDCTVTCEFPEPTEAPTVPAETQPAETQPVETQPAETQPAETTAPALDASKKYTMKVNGTKRKTYDITLTVGSSMTLTLTDEDGNEMDVDWQTNGPSYLTINGNKITAKKVHSALKVYVTVGETTYTCIVRVVKK